MNKFELFIAWWLGNRVEEAFLGPPSNGPGALIWGGVRAVTKSGSFLAALVETCQ